jgi:hypothetical protein
MVNEAPAAKAFASLGMFAALVEALLKRGVLEPADVDAIIKDAVSYVAALCVESGPEVEREARRLLGLIGKAEQNIAETQAPPIPVVDPASS